MLHDQHAPQPSADSVSIDALCSREAYVTNLQQFLDEPSTNKALCYWLSEFESIDKTTSTADVAVSIHASISRIDHLINDQLNLIIHHKSFQKLEASWRGLWHLVTQSDNQRNIQAPDLDIALIIRLSYQMP